jgi:hypothetical protein
VFAAPSPTPTTTPTPTTRSRATSSPPQGATAGLSISTSTPRARGCSLCDDQATFSCSKSSCNDVLLCDDHYRTHIKESASRGHQPLRISGGITIPRGNIPLDLPTSITHH